MTPFAIVQFGPGSCPFRSDTVTRCLLSGTAGFLALLAVVLLVSRPPPQLHAEKTSTARQIADLEKKLAELQKKLAELKAARVTPRPIDVDDVPNWRSARGG